MKKRLRTGLACALSIIMGIGIVGSNNSNAAYEEVFNLQNEAQVVSGEAIVATDSAVVVSDDAVKLASIQNPVVDSQTGEVTFSYLYFGNYPQSEVTGELLTEEIINAEYVSGDAVVGNEQYRRIESEEEYRYFKYEPIKWKVFEVEDGIAKLRTDAIIDCKEYNDYSVDLEYMHYTHWIRNTIRYWLNSLLANDKGFLQVAFNENEQNAIVSELLYDINYRIPLQLEVSDKVFLLAEWDLEDEWNREAALAKDTAYATAVYGREYGCNQWTLRATDNDLYGFCPFVDRQGNVCTDGLYGAIPPEGEIYIGTNHMNYKEDICGICPAINLDISNTDLWYTEEEIQNKEHLPKESETPLASEVPVSEFPVQSQTPSSLPSITETPTPSEELIVSEKPSTESEVPTTYPPTSDAADSMTSNPPITSENPITTESPVPSKPLVTEYVAGDTDGNGKIELTDAQLTLKAALRIKNLSPEETSRADIIKDTEINLKDAQKILKLALKIETLYF